jgi:hypothetical protein
MIELQQRNFCELLAHEMTWRDKVVGAQAAPSNAAPPPGMLKPARFWTKFGPANCVGAAGE